MASVFLSYDRDDADKARPIAAALEKAGHFVWWDLHIKGGAQFGKVIEEALSQADSVVVLWSQRSVESPWVRDEAAAGRDRGILIPVLIDGTEPPMGFRQYQSVDLIGWKGHGKPPHLHELLESIVALGVSHPEAAAAPPPQSKGLSNLRVFAALVAITLVGIAGAAFVWMRQPSADHVQTVAVVAAEPSAKPLARDLLVNLGSMQLARSGSLRLLGDNSASTARTDLIFEASGDPDANKPSANLLLVTGGDNSVLWSEDFEQESGTVADLKQQMAFTAARVLECALEARDTGGRALTQQSLRDYLNACAQLSEIAAVDSSPLIPGLLRVTRDAPWFTGGWAKLLTAEAQVLDPTDQQALKLLRQHIEAASKVDRKLPQIPLAQVAELGFGSFATQSELLDHAKNEHPDNPDVLGARSFFLMSVGRTGEALEDSRRSVELDPLSPLLRNEYISALMYAGRTDAAREELKAAERLWPGTATVRDIQFRYHLRFGDPKVAMALSDRRAGRDLDLYLRARIDPTAENVRRVTSYLPASEAHNVTRLSGLEQAMAEFHREDELFELLFQPIHRADLVGASNVWFRPALKRFREDPRFIQLAKLAGLLNYWRSSGKWPDFCFEPDMPYDCKKEAAKLNA